MQQQRQQQQVRILAINDVAGAWAVTRVCAQVTHEAHDLVLALARLARI
jgi:hypothetical protein